MELDYKDRAKVELSALAKMLDASSDWPGTVLEAAVKAKIWRIVKYLLIDSADIPRVLTDKACYTREDGTPLVYTYIGGNTEDTDYLELPTYLLIQVPLQYDDEEYVAETIANIYKHPIAGFLYARWLYDYRAFERYIEELVKRSDLSDSNWAAIVVTMLKTRGGYDAICKQRSPQSTFLLGKLFSTGGFHHLIDYVQWSKTKAAQDLDIAGIAFRECVDFIFEKYSHDSAALANVAIMLACAANEPIPAAHPAIIEYADVNSLRVCEYVMAFPQYADEILSQLKDI